MFDVIVDRIVALQSQAFWGLVLSWIIMAVAAGAIAGLKGHSGWVFGFLALILSPLIGLLVAAGLNDKRADLLAALSARVSAVEVGGLPPSAGSNEGAAANHATGKVATSEAHSPGTLWRVLAFAASVLSVIILAMTFGR